MGLANASAVKFGTALATIISDSDNQLVVTSPANPAGSVASTVDVTVVTIGGISSTLAADQFTYAPVPAVTSISPAVGVAVGGTTVTITGTCLATAKAVYFGSNPATIVSDTATQLVVSAPAGVAGTVDVTVQTAGGTSPTSVADKYTYVAAPTVTSIAPTKGPVSGGTTVTIVGTNLGNATAVNFGIVAATIVSDTANQLVVTSPVWLPGSVDVTVVTVGGTSATSSADLFTYVAVPVVTGVSPAAGPVAGGTTVTIIGAGLANASAVKFGGVPATIISDSDSQIVVRSPANVAGTVDVTVVTVGGTSAISALDQFTYAPIPAVASLSPSAGPVAGGITVTITGAGLANATAVKFGTALATVVSDSPTQLVVTSPAGLVGTVDVTVVTAGGVSALTAADHYTYVAAPTVTGVSPMAGPATGGTTVTITGTNLANAWSVHFGTTLAAILSNTGTQLVVTCPAGIAGTVDVAVTTAGGTSAAVVADQFTYIAAPTVTGVSPAAGPASGGTTVTITGANLANATAVKFGTALATIISDANGQLVVTSPANPAGLVASTVDITVITLGGTSATLAADQFTYAPAPVVATLNPSAGPVAGGTSVLITGTNLANATAVYFGTKAGTITAVSATQITVTSPAGVAGTVDVTVVTAGGTSATSTADRFTYVTAPAVTGVSPTVGPASGGTTVTITGTNLGNAWGVQFGNLLATIVSNSGTQLVVTSPANLQTVGTGTALVAGTVDITVLTAGGPSATSSADLFTYVAIPTVSVVTPAAGPVAGGTTVTIAGTNLANATAVKFGTVSATIISDSAGQIVVRSPANVAGTVDVTVVTAGGTSATSLLDQFTYAPIPMVASVNPWAGPLAGGTTVTITGTGLANATAVKFGTALATIVSASPTQLVVTSPAGLAGTVDVTVVTAGGTSAISAGDQFTYEATPAVTGVSPMAGPATGNTTVTITGTNLANVWSVHFGAALATIVSDTATQLVVTSPAGSAGTVDVTVATAGGSSAIVVADQFTYFAAPTVTGVSPTAGPAAGGTTVTITGTNLTNATAVKFGTVPATIVSDSAGQLVVTSPANIAGTVDVTVVTLGGTSVISAADQFTYAPAPIVAALNPSAGPVAGGTTVTITGTGLANATAVKFGTALATIITDTPTQLVVLSPASVAGAVDVTVVTPGGTSATSAADRFTYQATPTVTSVSPAAGPAIGNTTVTITGTNLASAWAVHFGATLATIVSDTATQLVVTSPAGAAGTVDVTVSTAGGTSATSAADQFTYVAAPTVTGVSPTSGPAAGGTIVTITGANLTNATAVKFGTVPATIVSDAANQLVVTSPANIAGTVDVTVVTAGGTSVVSAADQFTYAPLPVIAALNPSAGPVAGGTMVTITGTGLANATAVKFGTALATIVTDSPTQLVVISPAGAPSTVDVTVTTAGGVSALSASDRFIYATTPTVTGVVPAAGPATGGTTVTITGTNLTTAWAVHFGATLATIVSDTATQARGDQPGGRGRHGGRDGVDGRRHVGHFGGRSVHVRGGANGNRH